MVLLAARRNSIFHRYAINILKISSVHNFKNNMQYFKANPTTIELLSSRKPLEERESQNSDRQLQNTNIFNDYSWRMHWELLGIILKDWSI